MFDNVQRNAKINIKDKSTTKFVWLENDGHTKEK